MRDVRLPDGRLIKNVPEGTTKSQLMARVEKLKEADKAALSPEQREGLGRTVLEQGLQGATFGFSDEISNIGGAAIASALTDESFSDMLSLARQQTGGRLERQAKQRPKTAIASQLAGGIATGLGAASTKVGSGLAALAGKGGLATKIGVGAGVGAASGAAFGAGQAKSGERRAGAIEGAKFGALTGAALPVVGRAIKEAGRAVVPKIEEATKELARRAESFGIPLRVDQISPTRIRKTIQKVGQELPLSGADQFEDVQRKAFTKAVAKTIGQDAEDLSPATIKLFKADAKNKFDAVLKGKNVNVSKQDLVNIANIKQSVREVISEDLAKVVDTNVDKALSSLKAGDIKAEKLSSIRSRLIDNASKAKGGAGEFIGDIVDKIDDVTSRGLTKEEARKLTTARREWRNFKTIQPLLEKSTEGQINPTQLLNRVSSSKFIDASNKATGEDDLVDLARIGKQFLPKAGGSDTFQKGALTGAAGTLGVTAVANPALALQGAALTGGALALNRAVQATGRSQKLIGLATKAAKPAVKKSGKLPLAAVIAAQSQQ